MSQTYDLENVSNTNPSPNKGFMMSFKQAPDSAGGVGSKVVIAPGETRRVTFEGAIPQKALDLESAGDLNKTLIANSDAFSAAKMTGLLQKIDADAVDTGGDSDYEAVVDIIA